MLFVGHFTCRVDFRQSPTKYHRIKLSVVGKLLKKKHHVPTHTLTHTHTHTHTHTNTVTHTLFFRPSFRRHFLSPPNSITSSFRKVIPPPRFFRPLSDLISMLIWRQRRKWVATFSHPDTDIQTGSWNMSPRGFMQATYSTGTSIFWQMTKTSQKWLMIQRGWIKLFWARWRNCKTNQVSSKQLTSF